MHHPEIDPSLCPAEPPQDTLDDGFSPPAEAGRDGTQDRAATPAGTALTPKSPF